MSHSSSTAPDWAQLYHRSLGGGDQASLPAMFGHVSDSTVVTTTSSLPSQTTSTPVSVGTSNYSNIEGRVGKSTRRRTRASRKAPTTLLNTDTANFRAMVQQFTGIPSGPVVNYGLGYNENLRQATAVPPPYSHIHQSQYQLRQQQQYQQAQRGTMFTIGNNNHNTNDAAFQVLSDHRNGFEVSEGLFLDGLPGPNSTWQ